MIKIFSFSNGKLKEIDPTTLKKERRTSYWIDLFCSNIEEIKSIREIFDIHPAAEEDILSNQTRTKYEEFEENTAVIMQGIKEIEEFNIKIYNLSFIFGENYLITSHFENNEAIDSLISNPKKLENLMKKGAGHIFHYLLDKEIDKCMQIKSILLEEFKQTEKEFIKNPEKEVLEDLFQKELTLLETRQVMESLTDLCLSLTRPTDNYLDNELLPYFRDIYDHSFRTTESLKSMLGRINGMRNAYQTITSNRLNETMKILTMIMAIMMPITIVTGFYGMNVRLPLEDNYYSWIWILAIMIFVSLIMYLIFRRIKIN
ncbi:MAG: Magnesium transport protein CorA [Candidatus Diapherotrites archaeon ADurb.Bin253]|jgi:magnesium transporter|nr:magnesium transporter CorA family protein [Candidatus Pacearchaeota archaeon]OQA69175.1 MAG: Magnesium transport protein CorA [Candidatus Diapherotrites archaeon ADurb.Bin253]HNZ51965.1 magnesium transporter CorA family protein [Candidatus Pacearchaeota archaeon]HOC96696.1 magnesium transporter CorA family protein [Candidatus Pacearchaeota archaeon]HPX74416.1 magnesium transporter CorA family protein [Candidatus Pacearchaeota archaeon]